MRTWLAVLVLVPALADAQVAPADGVPNQNMTLPPIGLPLPPIGLPLPSLGLPPLNPPSNPAPRPPGRGDGWGSHGRPPRPRPIYVYPYYWGYGPPLGSTVTEPPAASAPAVPSRPTGTVWLDVEPRVGDVFVDDYFIGTVDDLRGSMTLDAGPHRVEIRAPGYETSTVDVRVEAGASITLRRMLEHLKGSPAARSASAPAAPAAAPIAHKPFYYIKGCYLGDVPPAAAHLPAGCDPSKAVLVEPR